MDKRCDVNCAPSHAFVDKYMGREGNSNRGKESGKEWKNRIDVVSVEGRTIDVQPLNRASWLDASTV